MQKDIFWCRLTYNSMNLNFFLFLQGLFERICLHLSCLSHAGSPVGWRRGRLIYIKGVSVRFGFDDRRTSQTLYGLSRTKQRKRPKGCIIYILNRPWCVVPSLWVYLYMYIGVGLSALLVSTIRAMRRPFYRGTSDRLAPRFFVYMSDVVCMFVSARSRRKFSPCGDKCTNKS